MENFVCVGNKTCVIQFVWIWFNYDTHVGKWCFRDGNAVAKTSGWIFLTYNEYGNILLSSLMVKNMNGQNEMMMPRNRNTIPVF